MYGRRHLVLGCYMYSEDINSARVNSVCGLATRRWLSLCAVKIRANDAAFLRSSPPCGRPAEMVIAGSKETMALEKNSDGMYRLIVDDNHHVRAVYTKDSDSTQSHTRHLTDNTRGLRSKRASCLGSKAGQHRAAPSVIRRALLPLLRSSSISRLVS